MSDKIVRIEKQLRKSGGPRTLHIYKCQYESCNAEVRVRKSDDFPEKIKKCISHSHTKRPFESLYNGIGKDFRELPCELTYEEFLEFTVIKNCHYCNVNIEWLDYSTVRGKFLSRAYYLDRMDSSLGYNKNNCVVCCSTCNKAKSNAYSYSDWYGMTEYLRNKNKSLTDTKE